MEAADSGVEYAKEENLSAMAPLEMEMESHDSVMNNVLVPMEMHPNDEEMQLDLVDTQPLDIEIPLDTSLTQPTRRRKKKSIVWEHFTIETVGPGCRRACCKQCKQSFAYSSGSKIAGTSHLKRHIAKGTCPVVLRNQDRNQSSSPFTPPSKVGMLSDTPKRRYRSANVPFFAFDADRCRCEIVKMIIMHDYPLHMVEHPGFIAFAKSLQPRFDSVSFNTVQGDCVATYLREKQHIQKVIEGVPGRVCLTLDLWSSCRTTGYVFVTGQFIDSDWRLHSVLFNVVMEPYPDSDTAFSHSIAACLSDWNMGGKLSSVTMNQPLGDIAVDNLRALLSIKNPLVLNGQLLLGNCLARSLSSIAKNAFDFAQSIVQKVRDSVKYVKTSESLEEKFLDLKQKLRVPTSKCPALDDRTKWNTTYEMLLTALELNKVFSCLETSDPDYRDAPSVEDWNQIETLCNYLKPLFETATLLTTSSSLTTNTYFHEAWKIQLELARAAASEDTFVSSLTRSMQERFDKYWQSCCFILSAAVVMDPRFKMKLVEFSFSKMYGEESDSYVKVVNDGIHELFHEYVVEETNATTIKLEDSEASNGISDKGHTGLADFDVYIMEANSQLSKSELDQYLEESLLPRVQEFDVMGWWKLNRVKYPTLSKMARDILSIPVCTVSGESVFDTTGKKMDEYRCSLRPETVEAVICAKSWLQREKAEIRAPIIKMELPI